LRVAEVGTTAGGSGQSYTYINGRFSYFVSASASGPVYTGATSTVFTIGATTATVSGTFDYDVNPISSISVGTLPSWLTYSSISQQFTIVSGATVTSVSTPYTINLVATDTTGLTGAGTFTFTQVSGSVPTFVPLGATGFFISSNYQASGYTGYFTYVAGTTSGIGITVTASPSLTAITGLTAIGTTSTSFVSPLFEDVMYLEWSGGATAALRNVPFGPTYTNMLVTLTATNAIGATWQTYYITNVGSTAAPGATYGTAQFSLTNNTGIGSISGWTEWYIWSDAGTSNLIWQGVNGIPAAPLSTNIWDNIIIGPTGLTAGNTYWATAQIQFPSGETLDSGDLIVSGQSSAYIFDNSAGLTQSWVTLYGITFTHSTSSNPLMISSFAIS
jgi:hypothetical protein